MRRCDECGAKIKEPETKDQHETTCIRSIYYVAVRPFDDQKVNPGRRLRIQKDDLLDLTTIADETTFPERVSRIDARNKTLHDSLVLTEDEAEWMRNRLIEVTHGALVFVALTREEWELIVYMARGGDGGQDDATIGKLEQQVSEVAP